MAVSTLTGHARVDRLDILANAPAECVGARAENAGLSARYSLCADGSLPTATATNWATA